MNKWFDSFNRELEDGDDVVIGINDNGKILLTSGIILYLSDDGIQITYNKWEGEKEIIRSKYYKPTGKNTYIKNIYKILYRL